MGDSPTEKKPTKCPHCPHRLSDPSFRFHIEMLETTSKSSSKPSQRILPSSGETTPIIESPEELNIEDIGTQNPKSNLDETTISFKQDTKTPLPEYLHLDEGGISHPLHPDLEVLLFGKETEILDPTSFTPLSQQSDSEVQALTFIDENGKVVNVIAEGEEADWSTSGAGIAHREICPVCLGVVAKPKDGKGDAPDGEGTEGEKYDGNEGGELADPKQFSMRGGGMGERRVCMSCKGKKMRSL
jgi:hypothetical protein